MKIDRLKVLIIVLALFSKLNICAQEEIPILTGKVEISISEGTFVCDLTLKEIPRIKDYFIRLNSGMNILYMRSKKPNDFLIYFEKSFNDSLSTGESNAYYFENNEGNGKFLPEAIQFRYVGKFPVIKDTIENYSIEDWKGNIAFNQNSVRADGYQSAWYPILYDIKNDKLLDKIKYDIKVVCTDCQTLYVNGNAPVKSKSYNFKSSVPVEILLFCGNYDFSNISSTYFLNSELNEEEIKTLEKLINLYKEYYSEKLNIPYNQSISFIQTTPTSKNSDFMFVSYPTIVSVSWQNGLKSIIEQEYKDIYRPIIAHELGHYYFGTYKVFNSELGDMMSEGFAEYLALQLTKEKIGTDVYNHLITRKIKYLKGFTPKPFAKIKSASEYANRELYVYYYAPIIFEAIEKEIGDEKMWKWLSAILKTSTKFTNYDFLISTLQKVLEDDTKLHYLEKQYFESNESLENAIKKIKKK